MRRLIQTATVAFAWFVNQLRRVPGERWVENRSGLICGVLIVLAALALGVWMAQRSPQRASMVDLTAGRLAPLQTWIVITGDVTAQPSTANDDLRYLLTDPAAPGSQLTIYSDVPLAIGRTTVSGTLLGGDAPAPVGYPWIGQLNADRVLTLEPDPPWVAMGLAGVAFLLVAVRRTSYPVFVRGTPRTAEADAASLSVLVEAEDDDETSAEPRPATLVLSPDAPTELHVPGQPSRVLRLHSVHSGADVGELRTLSSTRPALLLHPTGGELTIIFASHEDRDAAYAALTRDVLRRST